jgi:hypothetical protein
LPTLVRWHVVASALGSAVRVINEFAFDDAALVAGTILTSQHTSENDASGARAL